MFDQPRQTKDTLEAQRNNNEAISKLRRTLMKPMPKSAKQRLINLLMNYSDDSSLSTKNDSTSDNNSTDIYTPPENIRTTDSNSNNNSIDIYTPPENKRATDSDSTNSNSNETDSHSPTSTTTSSSSLYSNDEPTLNMSQGIHMYTQTSDESSSSSISTAAPRRVRSIVVLFMLIFSKSTIIFFILGNIPDNESLNRRYSGG